MTRRGEQGERRARLEQERRENRKRGRRAAPRTSRAAEHRGRPAGPGSVLPDARGGRRGSRRVIAAVVAALVLLVAAVVVLALLGDRDAGPDGDAGPGGGAADATTSTVLAAIAADGQLTGASLLAIGPDATSALLVPSRLLVDVPGGGRVPLAEALTVSADAAGDAVADALDVRVDGTWVLTAAGLAQLVDALGGVAADVDTPVRAGDVALAPGDDQQLTGEQAAALATALGEDEAEAARLARQEAVLAATVRALPDDTEEVTALLTSLTEESTSTFPDDRLAQLLTTASAALQDGSYGATVLPVREIATGGDEVLYGIDDAGAAELLASRFADVRRAGAEDAVRVLVQNGAGTPGLGDAARDRLVEAGFRFVGGGNAATLGRATSVVLVPSDERADREAGAAVAEALGLSPDVVAVGQEAPTTAEVVVVLGQDFAELARGST